MDIIVKTYQLSKVNVLSRLLSFKKAF